MWTVLLPMRTQALVVLWEGLWVTVPPDVTGIVWGRSNTGVNSAALCKTVLQ